MKNATVRILSGLGLSVLVASAWSGTIKDIKVSSTNNDQKVVKVFFQDGATIPKGFLTDTPAQVVLDFNNTALGLQQREMRFNDNLLSGISANSDNSRTRVALALNKQGQYRVERKGENEVWVYVNSSANVDSRYAPVSVATTREENRRVIRQFANEPQKVSAKAVNVDMRFNKTAQGAGVMTFNIPTNYSEPKVERSKNAITLTFDDVYLLPAAQKTYDVSEYDTPAKKVSLQSLGKGTKVVISNGSSWDYSTKRQGNAYVVTVSQQGNLFNSLDEAPKRKTFNGGRITLDFQDVDVRTVLQILAKESGINIVASDSVRGKMTLNLKDVPWDQALDLVMQSNNLDMRRQGNIINIAPRDELMKQERAIIQNQKELNEMGALHSRTFQLKYKSVEDFREVLKSVESGSNSSSSTTNTILSGRGSVMFDSGTNTMIITDVPSVLNKFEKLIAQLDVPVRQVMIEARIVEVSEEYSRELGVRWGGGVIGGSNGRVHGVGGPMTTDGKDISLMPSPNNNGGITWGHPNVNLGIGGLGGAGTAGFTLFRQAAHSMISLELTAMQDSGKGKIVSTPKVLTQDRKEANLQEGTEIAYKKDTSSGATSIEWRKAVTGLKVTPQITPDGQVIMQLDIRKETPDWAHQEGGQPAINTKNVQTTAMVENGGTMVVGGIYVEEDSNSNNSVPLLGDIPVIGNLFKHQTKKKSRRELLIFITPRIVDTLNSSELNY